MAEQRVVVVPEVAHTNRYIGPHGKDHPSHGDGEGILDELDVVLEVGGQVGGRVDDLLPRVIDTRRLVVIIWPRTPGWCRWQTQERLCIYLANLELFHVQHVVVVGVEVLPLVPPRLAAGGLGSRCSSGGRHHPPVSACKGS